MSLPEDSSSDVSALKGFSLGFEVGALDKDEYVFPETTTIQGFSIGFDITEGDKRYLENTSIFGFSIGFEDYPIKVYTVNTKRL